MEEPILKYFNYEHLPNYLAKVCKPFSDLSQSLLELPKGAERTVALRKLLESKDAAIRAALEAP